MTEPVIINHLVRARSYDDKGKTQRHITTNLYVSFLCVLTILTLELSTGLNMKVLM